MLHLQFYRDGLPRYLDAMPGATGTSIASKTGSLDALRADIGAVSTPAGVIVMSIFTYANADRSWTPDQEGELTIAKLSRAIVHAWSPTGLAPWPTAPLPATALLPGHGRGDAVTLRLGRIHSTR
jgi:beta-lactamase class A